MRKLKYSKHGLCENPLGYTVRMTYLGQELTGRVVNFGRHDVTGAFLLSVVGKDGKAWPVQPVASVVDVLER